MPTSLIIIIVSFLVIGSILSLLYLLLQFMKESNKQSFNSVTNFESYLAILVYHMEKAYEITYKDKVMIYSIEGMKLNEEQFQMISKQYASLVLKMIGSNVKDSLVDLYGDEQTLLFNILEYFSSKYETDEVFKASTENLIFGEDTGDFWSKLNNG